MKLLAIIPARGGSKRVPGKNVRGLGGKPLIVWSVEAAFGIPEICDTLVSTDDPAIAETCIKANVLVPWLRPAELATDTSKAIDAVLHALDWYEADRGKVDGVLLLQPTSPFRKRDTVRRGIKLFSENGHNAVIGVSPATSHPMWTFKLDGDRLVPFLAKHGLHRRSQDLPAAYVVNGSFYLISPAELRAGQSFFGARISPLVMDDPEEALDIDTPWDFRLAELIAGSR